MNEDKEFTISEKNKIFKISFKYSSYKLINSLLNTYLIIGGNTDNLYKSIIFKAKTVMTFNQYKENKKKKYGKNTMSISDIIQMISTLAIQLDYLIKNENVVLLGYNPNKIIVINENIFLYLDNELISIDKNKEILITYPILPNEFFLSPELIKINEIPHLTHYKTCYFSFALLIFYCIFDDYSFYYDYLKNEINLIEKIKNHPIRYTKIYFILSNCLIEDIKKRNIILL